MKETVHNKLVRDRIPEIIQKDGESPEYYVLGQEAYRQALLAKLIEEAEEFRDNPTPEERADIEEVLRALDDLFGFTADDIEAVRQQKLDDRGGFKKQIFLERVRRHD